MTLPRTLQVRTASTMIGTLSQSGFFGELVLKFEAGNIVHIRQITNAKIDDVTARLEGHATITAEDR